MKLKYNYTIMCDLKAELKLSPAEREQDLRAPHSKVADRTAGGGDCKKESGLIRRIMHFAMKKDEGPLANEVDRRRACILLKMYGNQS